jgi:DNA-binding SARP family transcriptional activator
LLFYLAVTRQRHSRQELAGLLWSEKTEERARNNLRVELNRLRPFLEGHLDIQRPSLRMRSASGVVCDVTDFLALVEAHQPTLRQLQTAVDLYQGDFLEDFNLPDAILFEEWAQELRAYLREQVLEALYQIVEYHSQQKNYRAGIESARRLLALEPWLEKAYRQLMWMLAKSGDRVAALAQYESCCELLDEELGVEPEAETIVLYEQIKSGEIAPDEEYSQTEVVIAPPFQAPKLTENFVGRDLEIAWLLDTLTGTESDDPVAVVGMGGMGKTTLAVAVCQALRDEFEDGVLWANVASSDPAAILEDWAQAFGYDFSRLPDVESRAAALRGVLAEKQVLMVLDDVVSLARIRPLLPHAPSVKVLITTREVELACNLGDQVQELGQLSSVQAGQLLSQIVGEERVTEEAAAAQAICDLLQNLPLAVEIVGQRLRLFRSMTLAEMADRLRNERQRLAELELSDQAVRASFAISYRALDSYEKRSFALMGVFNGRSFPRDAFAAIAELDYFTAGDRLFSLEGASLVQMGEDGRFQQHPLLADFARELLEAGEEREEGYGRYVQHYLRFAQENQHNYDALRPEWDNMMAAMETADDHHLWQQVIDFTDALHDAWFARGRFSLARQGCALVNTAVQKLQNKFEQKKNLLRWGEACIEQNDYKEAALRLRSCLEQCERSEDELLISTAQFHLARIAIEQADYEDATSLLEESKLIRESLGDVKGFAAVIFRQARIALHQNDLEKMGVLGRQALALQEAQEDYLGQIPTLRLLAQHAMRTADYALASVNAERAVNIAKQLDNNSELASALYALAGACRLNGNLERAQKYAEECLEVFLKIGDRKFLGMTYLELCLINRDRDKFLESIEYGKKGIDLLYEVNASYALVEALFHIGNIYKQCAQLDKAQVMWQEAFKVSEKTAHPRLTTLRKLLNH